MGRVSEVSVLRGVTVVLDGRGVEVTGTRLRALLALLAAAPGEVRRAEYLADQLWNGEPPSANALQALVSRLRRVVGAESLPSRPTGYLLDVEPAQVDLARFEHLAELGTPEAAREALALAGPEPLAEFADVPDLAGLSRVLESECNRLAVLAEQCSAAPGPAAAPVDGAAQRPPLPHRLIGRDAVLIDIQDRLGSTRLLTLTGAGGSGKTSLARAVASSHAAVTHVAELAPVAPNAVDAEVYAAVGGHDSVLGAGDPGRRDTREAAERLLAALGDRPALLVLDNCEHVIDAAAGLAAKVLAHCPRVTILATSREPLGVPGEQRLPVDPLAVPPRGLTGERLGSYSAMQLLLERGRAVRPGLAAKGADGAALAEICRRLDGIPLALELAAARFGVLTPRQVADRLDDRFRLLTTGARTALPRQQTLRAVVDWSWDLLSAEERGLLSVCGVFSGAAALEDLEAVAGLDALDALDLVDRLVSKSLVLAEPAAAVPGSDAGMRYRLLETIREYALERLAEQGACDRTRTRHAHHFADVALTADARLRGPGQVRWMMRLDDVEDNLRAALDWSIESGDAVCALRLCKGLGWYSMVRGKQFDRVRIPRVVKMADELGVPHDAIYLRVVTFNALYAFERGVPPEEAAVQLSRIREQSRSGEWKDALYSLAEIGASLFTEPESVDEVFEREYARLAASGDEWGLACARMFHAKVLMDDPDQAEELTWQALEAFRALDEQWGIANCSQTMAMIESQRGRHREALAVLEGAMAATRLIGSASDEIMMLVMAAAEYDSLGRPGRAEKMLAQAHDLAQARPEAHANLYMMTYECARARRLGRLDQSQVWLDEVERAAGATFIRPVLSLLRTQQAWITIARGELDEAERLIDEAFQHAIAFHFDRPDIGQTIEARAALEFARGDAHRAAWLLGLFAVVRGRELPLSATPDLAATAAAVRAELGEDGYDAAYAQGRAVPSESVLAVCREFFGAEYTPKGYFDHRDRDQEWRL